MLRITSLRFAKTSQEARRLAAKDFGFTCLCTGLQRSDLGEYGPLDPAHWFSASIFPEVAKCLENIYPLGHYFHNGGPHSLDAISGHNMRARTIWMADHIYEQYRGLCRVRMEKLLREISPYSPRIAGIADELHGILARMA